MLIACSLFGIYFNNPYSAVETFMEFLPPKEDLYQLITSFLIRHFGIAQGSLAIIKFDDHVCRQ